MRVLIACEFSGIVREAFRKRGHDAWSCDLLPAEDKSYFHIEGDVLEHLNDGWDLMIAHPPCTRLASSGARWFSKRVAEQDSAIWFFMQFVHSQVSRVAIENPVGIMSNQYRKPDQIIQPWMFGHPESKATCLWLKGLPLLVPTNDVRAEMEKLPLSKRTRVHYASPGPDRWKERSRTMPGIAEAMADQWGGLA